MMASVVVRNSPALVRNVPAPPGSHGRSVRKVGRLKIRRSCYSGESKEGHDDDDRLFS